MVCNIRIIEVGAIVCERIIAEQLKEGDDYEYSSVIWGFGVIKIDKITIKSQKPGRDVEQNSYYSDCDAAQNGFMDQRLSYSVYSCGNDKQNTVTSHAMNELNELRSAEVKIINSDDNQDIIQKKENKLEELRNVLDSTLSPKLIANDDEVSTHSLIHLLTHLLAYSCRICSFSLIWKKKVWKTVCRLKIGKFQEGNSKMGQEKASLKPLNPGKRRWSMVQAAGTSL